LRLESLADSPEAFGATVESALARPECWWQEALDKAYVLGAFEAGAMIGMARLDRLEGPKERHKCSLTGMYVRAGCRRAGVGRALLDAAEAIASAFAEQLLINVVAANLAARRFYEGCGFVVYGEAPRALKIEGRYENELLMVKFLSAPIAE